MRTSASPLCILSLLTLIAQAGPVTAQQRRPAPQQQSQSCCRIEGEVVRRDGDQYGPVVGVRVVLRRDKMPLKYGVTDKTGRYSIRFESGGPIDVKYGDEEQWEPAMVEHISGRRDHRITKVLLLRHAGRLTHDEAAPVVATLEYMNNHPADFAAELNKYTATLNKDEFPPEFHERLSRIEQAVAARRNEKPALPSNQFAPPGLVKPISLEETAAQPPRRGGFRLEPPRLGPLFTLHLEELKLPPEVQRLRHAAAPGGRSASDWAGFGFSVLRRSRPDNDEFVVRGGYGIFYTFSSELHQLVDDTPQYSLGARIEPVFTNWAYAIQRGNTSLAPVYNRPYDLQGRFTSLDPGYFCAQPLFSPLQTGYTYRFGARFEF